MLRRFLLIAAIGAAVTGSALGQSLTHGITGDPAPPWRADDWINLPRGTYDLEVADLRGKIVFLLCFQAACPGCHNRALPNLQRLIKHYEDADDVRFVAIQTAFEGYDRNTAKAAWATAGKFNLLIPVGHTGGLNGPSPFIRQYNTAGTPWSVIIDQEGMVRYNDFHAPFAYTVKLIDELRAEAGPPGDRTGIVETLPPSRGGQQLLGERLPTLEFDRRIDGRTPEPDTQVTATLYRWWTDGCPYCRASLPAVERLRKRYADRGLRVVGVYHPKPPRGSGETSRDDNIVEHARYLGYNGVVAVDEDWSALDQVWPANADRRATSITLLVDAGGVIRFVHPGPVYFRSGDMSFVRENADFLLLEKAVRTLVSTCERAPEPGSETP